MSKGTTNITKTKQKRRPHKYTDEFKHALVNLYCSGKNRCDICRDYDITPFTCFP
ncbi:MAG: transposase [Lachnospiraceae bacterium]|nr:transposase [Lachnospiraceae bacterium]